MKILLLAPFDIFPPVHGGSTSVYNIIKYISRYNQVYVLLTHLHSQGGKIDLIHQNVKINYCPKSIFDRLTVLPTLINPYYLKSAYKIAKNSNSDVIQCQTLWTSFAGILLKKKLNRPFLLVEHNVEYLKFKSFKGMEVVARFVKKVEKIACELADRIVVFSEINKTQLINLYNIQESKIQVITSCPDLEVLKENKGARKTVREKYGVNEKAIILTFVGNLVYIPNVTAVKHIAERIYTVIVDKYPDSIFLIVGQRYENVLKYKRENIIFTGYLDMSDLADHLSASDIVMVPIDSGSGVRRKVLDAAACSKPIVSTKKGAEGLAFENNREIIVTDQVDEEFIAVILRLIENEKLRDILGKNARKKVEEQYGWEQEAKKLQELYISIGGQYEN